MFKWCSWFSDGRVGDVGGFLNRWANAAWKIESTARVDCNSLRSTGFRWNERTSV
jgi:hypothetical protein